MNLEYIVMQTIYDIVILLRTLCTFIDLIWINYINLDFTNNWGLFLISYQVPLVFQGVHCKAYDLSNNLSVVAYFFISCFKSWRWCNCYFVYYTHPEVYRYFMFHCFTFTANIILLFRCLSLLCSCSYFEFIDFVAYYHIIITYFYNFLFYILFLLFQVVWILFLLLAIMLYSLYERKVLARIQQRTAPKVAGISGILQAIADGLKIMFKVQLKAKKSNNLFFYLSPALTFFAAIVIWLFVPTEFGFFINSNYSLLYILFFLELHTLGLILAGFFSFSYYALLGSLRLIILKLSASIYLTFIFLLIILLSGSGSLVEIINDQIFTLNLIPFFLVFIIYILSIFIEVNRIPFDLPESEGELIAGVNIEYSSGNFALFSLGEYLSLCVNAYFLTYIFIGAKFLINIFFIDLSTMNYADFYFTDNHPYFRNCFFLKNDILSETGSYIINVQDEFDWYMLSQKCLIAKNSDNRHLVTFETLCQYPNWRVLYEPSFANFAIYLRKPTIHYIPLEFFSNNSLTFKFPTIVHQLGLDLKSCFIIYYKIRYAICTFIISIYTEVCSFCDEVYSQVDSSFWYYKWLFRKVLIIYAKLLLFILFIIKCIVNVWFIYFREVLYLLCVVLPFTFYLLQLLIFYGIFYGTSLYYYLLDTFISINFATVEWAGWFIRGLRAWLSTFFDIFWNTFLLPTMQNFVWWFCINFFKYFPLFIEVYYPYLELLLDRGERVAIDHIEEAIAISSWISSIIVEKIWVYCTENLPLMVYMMVYAIKQIPYNFWFFYNKFFYKLCIFLIFYENNHCIIVNSCVRILRYIVFFYFYYILPIKSILITSISEIIREYLEFIDYIEPITTPFDELIVQPLRYAISTWIRLFFLIIFDYFVLIVHSLDNYISTILEKLLYFFLDVLRFYLPEIVDLYSEWVVNFLIPWIWVNIPTWIYFFKEIVVPAICLLWIIFLVVILYFLALDFIFFIWVSKIWFLVISEMLFAFLNLVVLSIASFIDIYYFCKNIIVFLFGSNFDEALERLMILDHFIFKTIPGFFITIKPLWDLSIIFFLFKVCIFLCTFIPNLVIDFFFNWVFYIWKYNILLLFIFLYNIFQLKFIDLLLYFLAIRCSLFLFIYTRGILPRISINILFLLGWRYLFFIILSYLSIYVIILITIT